MAGNASVSLYTTTHPNFRDTALPEARRLAEALLPEVREGKLTLAKAFLVDAPSFIFRIPDTTGWHAIYIHEHALQPLNSLSPPPDAILIKRELTTDEFHKLTRNHSQLPSHHLEPPTGTIREQFSPGKPRDLTKHFQFLNDCEITRLLIRDRYCLSEDWTATYLEEFITLLASLSTHKVAQVTIEHGPIHYNDSPHEARLRFQNLEQKLKKTPSFFETRFRHKLRAHDHSGTHHDRSIKIHTIPHQKEEAGGETPSRPQAITRRGRRAQRVQRPPETIHLIELSGGISKLMDESQETVLYRIPTLISNSTI